ncbi:MAG: hypothetical protein ACKOBW_15255 [Planctomycetota bacterium]
MLYDGLEVHLVRRTSSPSFQALDGLEVRRTLHALDGLEVRRTFAALDGLEVRRTYAAPRSGRDSV